MPKRAFLIVLDSFGIGNAPDARDFGDKGTNTLLSCSKSQYLNLPVLQSMGLYNLDGVTLEPKAEAPSASLARLVEVSAGKDTTIGHWEIAGQVSPKALPTFPEGFPEALLERFKKATGRGVLCNKPYSGTDVLRDYGEEHLRTGDLIVYTSADSVFQVAANEAIVPLEELYRYCEIARSLLTGDWAVGRVIARPFVGDSAATFARTPNRHDYSLKPPAPTVLDDLVAKGREVIGVGKIYDIFDGQGVTKTFKTKNNDDGMARTLQLAEEDFDGLAFVNLVDFDMVYGHRNDVDGYAKALTAFDAQLGQLLPKLREDDLLILTADHGCDPGNIKSTDHSRECVPLIVYGKHIKPGVNLGTLSSFATIANLVAAWFGLPARFAGQDILHKIGE